MTIKPLKIAAQIIFMDRQINTNTRTFKIIPYNQEIYKLNMMRYFCGSVYLYFKTMLCIFCACFHETFLTFAAIAAIM